MSANYETVSAKLGKVQPATRSISREIFDAAAKAGHEIRYMWGMGTSSEHATGRALDLMVYNEAAGDWIKNYIWTNRERLRLVHVIWEQHITSTVTQIGKRRKMADRGSVTENHYDHVHVLFFAGSYQKPGSPSSPDPSTPSKKTIDELAKEVIRGEWGNGPARVRKLLTAGYDPKKVQARVEEIMNPVKGKKTVQQVAAEVLKGRWGNDPQRSKDLKEAGYNPKNVQREVNKLVAASRR